MGKRITVVNESESGRNQQFRDNVSGETMSRPVFVQRIESGQYPNYHVRNIEGVKTPASNPDGSDRNNLG
jgi:alpha-acetolactate decarboxylase